MWLNERNKTQNTFSIKGCAISKNVVERKKQE